MASYNAHCPVCGERLKGRQYRVVANWRICAIHWADQRPNKFLTRCHECLGTILPGEDIMLARYGEDRLWVVLHRRDLCEGEIPEIPVEADEPTGPWATLYLVPGAPPEVIKAVYRALSQIHHPDRGGDVAKMQEINAAVAALLK